MHFRDDFANLRNLGNLPNDFEAPHPIFRPTPLEDEFWEKNSSMLLSKMKTALRVLAKQLFRISTLKIQPKNNNNKSKPQKVGILLLSFLIFL